MANTVPPTTAATTRTVSVTPTATPAGVGGVLVVTSLLPVPTVLSTVNGTSVVVTPSVGPLAGCPITLGVAPLEKGVASLELGVASVEIGVASVELIVASVAIGVVFVELGVSPEELVVAAVELGVMFLVLSTGASVFVVASIAIVCIVDTAGVVVVSPLVGTAVSDPPSTASEVRSQCYGLRGKLSLL